MSQQPIRLGLMPPLSGLVELYGSEISRAGQIACDEINEQGGVLGRKLELIIEDDGSLPETAVPAALKLVEEHGCVAIIGNLLSNSRISVANHVAEPLKIPYLNFSFYEGSISGRYFFHFAALPNQQIDKMIPYMINHFGSKMFFAGNNYEWPRGSIDACKRSLLKHGGEIVGEEYFEIGTDNFEDLLNQVSNSGADVFVPYAAGSDQLKLLTDFSEKGLKERMAVVMGHYDEAMMSSLSPEIRQGFFSSNTYFMSIDSEENKKYLSRLEQQPGVEGIWPDGNGVLTNFGEGTYLCVHAFAKAANLAGSIDAEKLVDTLETIQVTGPQGTVKMDRETHHAHINTYLSQCQLDGTFKIIESFGCIAPEIPARYKKDFQRETIQKQENTLEEKGKHRVLIGVIEADNGQSFEVMKAFSGFGDHFMDKASMLELMVLIQSQSENLEKAWRRKEALRLSDSIPLQYLKSEIIAIPLINKGICTSFAIFAESGSMDSLEDGYFSEPENDSLSLSDLILEKADSAIIATNSNGIIINANKQANKLFNYTEAELIGLDINILLPPHLREKHRQYFTSFVNSELTEMVMGDRGEVTGYRKDGSFFPAATSITKITANFETILVVTLRDLSSYKREEELLVWKATHDPLTTLPNRSLIKDRIANALARSERSGTMVVLMFIDVDQFKMINDSCGHDAGDHLLIDIAKRLVEVVRPGDTVARFGGDEFIILCDQVSDDNVVIRLVERIVKNVKQPVKVADSIFYPTISVGIAKGYGGEVDANELLQNADTAMYIAKDKGRDGWKIYDKDIGENIRINAKLSGGLREAIGRHELEAYFQPIVDTNSLEIVGAETLLRWHHNGGMISPAEFIPIAEMTGSIVELGYWVFEESCKQQAALRKYFCDDDLPYIAINLSARQLIQHNLIEEFEKILKKYNTVTRHIVIEITESILMIDIERSLKMLHRLGDIGLTLAIDDFGTGHSSLHRIKSLPVDTIKVDQSFIRNIHTDTGNQAITRAVINMAHALGLKVTAEGVEVMEELNVLRDMNCNRVQGYLFDKPLTTDQFIDTLSNHKHGYKLAV